MSESWNDDELRGTIKFEDVELIEITDEPDDLLEAVAQGATAENYFQSMTTNEVMRWESTPPLGSWNPMRAQRAPFDEVTAVRRKPETDAESHWVDIHAIVGRDGELRLPERLAQRLREGTVVEVRVAAWAVADG